MAVVPVAGGEADDPDGEPTGASQATLEGVRPLALPRARPGDAADAVPAPGATRPMNVEAATADMEAAEHQATAGETAAWPLAHEDPYRKADDQTPPAGVVVLRGAVQALPPQSPAEVPAGSEEHLADPTVPRGQLTDPAVSGKQPADPTLPHERPADPALSREEPADSMVPPEHPTIPVTRMPGAPLPALPPRAPGGPPAGNRAPAPAAKARSGGGRKALLALCTAIVVGAIGTAAYYAYAEQPPATAVRTLPTATSVPSTAPASSAPSTVPTAILDSEATDPRKLTLAEAFPDSRISLNGRTFKRVKANVTDNCDQAAAGAFADALKKHHCRRVLRATYVDGKHQYAVTTGIAVLPTKDAALIVDHTKNLGGNLWFRGLNGDASSGADRVAISGGYAAGMVWGRYIVFSYATYADGHTPAAKEKDLGPVSGAFRDHTAEVIEKRVTS